ncbi:MAG: hypothetical protein ACSW8F_06020 [bacterium]
MKKATKKSGKKRTGIITWCIIVGLTLYLGILFFRLQGSTRDAESRKDQLTRDIAAVTAENEEMQNAIDHKDDPAVMERIARGEGYIFQDEEVYYAE